MNAFSSVEDQEAALQKWKSKSALHDRKVGAIQSSIKTQKKKSEKKKKKDEWLVERERIQSEESTCRDEYQVALMKVGNLVSSESAELEQLRDCIVHSLLEIQNETARATRQKVPLIQEKMSELRDLLNEQLESAKRDYAKIEQEENEASVQLNPIDVNLLVENTDSDFQAIIGQYGENEEICRVFEDALSNEREKLERKIAECSTAITVPASVLRSAQLWIKLKSRSKKGTLTVDNVAPDLRRSVEGLTLEEAREAVTEAFALEKQHNICRAAAQDYRKNVRAVLDSCQSALQAQEEIRLMNDSLQEEARAREAAANKLHQELEAKRAVYDEKVAAELEKQKEIQAEAERVEAEMRAKRNEEFQERLERFREYEAAKKVLQEEEERMKKQQEEEEARNRAERMLVNGGRVKYRQQETKERMEERKRQEESLNELKRQKALALERFFASVDEKIGVESDPSRILQGTVSSEQRPAETANTSPSLHGYTDDQVMKDPRARLFHALLEVGLHQGPYAREVMSRGYRVSPAQQTSDTNPFRGDF